MLRAHGPYPSHFFTVISADAMIVSEGLLYLLDVTTQFPVPRARRIGEGGALYPAAIA